MQLHLLIKPKKFLMLLKKEYIKKKTRKTTSILDKVFNHKQLKILTPKETALSQVKTGNKSENLLNEIRQIIYSLYWQIELTKKAYNNKMNLIKL